MVTKQYSIPSELPRVHPWLTEDAITFLEHYFKHNSNAQVLEFGCGGSTVWFAQRSQQLVSIEHNPLWHQKVFAYLKAHNLQKSVNLQLVPAPYHNICANFSDESFDLVLVDGLNRMKCIEAARRLVKSGGILMLDNAERPWYKKAHMLLSGWKFTTTIATKPDQYGFMDEGWQTNWWIKP